MADLAASSSSSSSSSSSPLLTGDEIEFNRIRPEGSHLPYGRLGHFSEDVMNELAAKWFEGDPVSKGILQSIWNLHPSNPKNQQAADGSGGGQVQRGVYKDEETYLQNLINARLQTDDTAKNSLIHSQANEDAAEGAGDNMMRTEGETFLALSKIFGDANNLVEVFDRGIEGKQGRLVVRSFYNDLARDMFASIRKKTIQRVFLSGTPGTGKSVFRNYFAWFLIQHFISEKNTLRIAMHKGGHSSFTMLCVDVDENTNISSYVEVCTEMDVKRGYGSGKFQLGLNFFGLSDVSLGNTEHCDIFNNGLFIFTSPNERAFGQGGKAYCAKFYMPLWEKNELCRYDNEREFEKRFQMYGGIARIVWGQKHTVSTHDTSLRSKMLSFEQVRAEIFSNAIESKSHRFVYLVVPKVNNNFDYKCSSPKLLVQTRYIADIIADHLVENMMVNVSNFGDLRHPTVQGILFERLALRFIQYYRHRCVFHVQRMTRYCQFPLLHRDFLTFPKDMKTTFFEENEFLKAITSPDDVLALPKSNYFPGFDGVVSFYKQFDQAEEQQQPKYLALLQMTCADTHPLSAAGLKLLKAACELKSDKEKDKTISFFQKIVIIYVLPTKNAARNFGVQQLQEENASSSAAVKQVKQVAISIGLNVSEIMRITELRINEDEEDDDDDDDDEDDEEEEE